MSTQIAKKLWLTFQRLKSEWALSIETLMEGIRKQCEASFPRYKKNICQQKSSAAPVNTRNPSLVSSLAVSLYASRQSHIAALCETENDRGWLTPCWWWLQVINLSVACPASWRMICRTGRGRSSWMRNFSFPSLHWLLGRSKPLREQQPDDSLWGFFC